MNYTQKTIADFTQTLKDFGFTVYIGANGTHGSYTDDTKERVVGFQVEYLSLVFSGRYESRRDCGSGWRIENPPTEYTKESLTKLLYTPAPRLANKSPVYAKWVD